ncbi:HAD family hydrolase [Kytococcus sp. Marseille-QA3725]
MLFATDLDGTLVSPGDPVLSPTAADVLERVDASGVPVVFVTARPLRWMTELWPHVGRHGAAVVSNGAVTWDVHEGQPLEVHGLAPATGLALVDHLRSTVPEARFAIECLDGIRCDVDYPREGGMQGGAPFGKLADLWDEPALKLLVRHDAGDPAIRERIV